MAGLWVVQQSTTVHPVFGLVIQQFGLQGALFYTALVGVIGLYFLGSNRRATRKFFCLLALGFLAAYCLASTIAAQRLLAQVPLHCHKTELVGEFRLLDQALRQDQKINWTFAPTAPHPCLAESSKLSMNLDQSLALQSRVQVGDVFKSTVALRVLHAPLQLQGFDVHQHWMSRGISGLAIAKSMPVLIEETPSGNPMFVFSRTRNSIRLWLQHALNERPQLPLIMAMVIGDQGLIDQDERELYNTTGIAHLVAISGLHITLFALVAGRLFEWLWKRSVRLCLLVPSPLAGAIGGLMFAIAYALIAGWAPPAQRTVFMLMALLISQCRHSNSSPWDTWCIALLLTMLGNPWSILDFGFLLSFGAVAVLIFTHHGHHQFSHSLPVWLAKPVKAQYVVTVGLLVPSIAMFNQQSAVSLFTNALSIPWMTFVSTPLALIGGLLRQHWALALSAESLSIQQRWLEYFAQLDWATLVFPDPAPWAVLLGLLGTLILLTPRHTFPKWLGLILIIPLFLNAPRPEQNDFWLTAMDVGQGTAIAIQTRHHILIYDTGAAHSPQADNGQRVVLPWLKSKGYDQVNSIWVSHDDNDHAGGAASVIQKTPIGQFSSPLKPDHPLNTLARQKGATVNNCHTLLAWEWDGVRFEPLALPARHLADETIKDNNKSCVLRISNAKHSVLLTGDIETTSEQALLRQHGADRLRSTLLLVPHHGSKTSSSGAFLAAVQPQLAIIQAGWKNQYGHPHPVVLNQYRALGIETMNTAQLGALEFKFQQDSSAIEQRIASQERRRYWHLHETGASEQSAK